MISKPGLFESLENRTLLHGNLASGLGANFGRLSGSIEFSQAPSAVQSGLDSLATTDGQTAPASDSTDRVLLGNRNGVETYTIVIRGTGTVTRITVDQNGAAVTSATRSKTTFADLDSAVSSEIAAIATALNLTAPASTTSIAVSTPADGGAAVYSARLNSAATTGRHRPATISVDANGNPVGNQNLPFSVLPSAIQTGLNHNVPSGGTALDTTSTQNVAVRTLDGVVLYTTTFSTSGTNTSVTVDKTGALKSLPSRTTANFSTIPQAAQTELQSLATDAGSTDTIAATATTTEYNEANGNVIYAVTVSVTSTDSAGNSRTRYVTVAVDAAGNPTDPPAGDVFPLGTGDRGPGGGCGGDGGGASTSTGSTGGSSTGTTTTGRRGSNGVLSLRR